jgi:non-lysosomal glucosylceramidase
MPVVATTHMGNLNHDLESHAFRMKVPSSAGLANDFDSPRLNDGGAPIPGGTCCPPPGMDRRLFLRTIGAGTLFGLGFELPIMAGPFDNPAFDKNVPADKKLDPAWVKALFERGTPEVFSHEQLRTLKLPIGGICTGHVYLNGQGKMVNWMFDQNLVTLSQGFSLRTVVDGKTDVHDLDEATYPDMTFRGEYPVAKVTYAHADIPIETRAEIFSPFIPLNADDSGLPATVYSFTLKNTSDKPVEATLAGQLENGAYIVRRFGLTGMRRNQVIAGTGMTILHCTGDLNASQDAVAAAGTPRPDIIFENWDKDTFDGWTVEGDGFGVGPYTRAQAASLSQNLGGESDRVVNSYLKGGSNAATGKLTSKPFTLSRRYVKVCLGGGNAEGKVGARVVVDGQVVQSATGANKNELMPRYLDMEGLEGKQATIEIFDNSQEAWMQVGAGRITFTDTAPGGAEVVSASNADEGTMALALLGPPAEFTAAKGKLGFEGQVATDASVPISRKLAGSLGRTVQLKPGETAQVNFVIAWHFQNLTFDRMANVGRYYAKRFDSAQAVASYVGANFDKLAATTRLWRDTWYDSTLPYWFLDRTFINTSTLATSGAKRFANGRFWAWEGGPDCCAGTCTHVWQYAHSMSRVFPELERDTRERVDLGISLNKETGVSGFRGEYDMSLAVDGQTGTLLRIYREHQMSSDDSFLKRNWANIKLMYMPLFALDPNEEGIMDGKQMNTLDRSWYGQISWMSSMYSAACRAGEMMATEMGDAGFQAKCKKIADNGYTNISMRLFNGEYFFSTIDPKHVNEVNSGQGSLMDQVYGQSWGFQVGLPRILPEKETRTALKSLWTYNFSPDAGAFFADKHIGRKFVSIGDAGMIMCTFPRTDWNFAQASGGGAGNNGFAYYFVECWTGNEYQVAGHMFWEGMQLEPLAMVRAIHDRYHPLKRNPYSEEECGEQYSRALASHGAFIGACGYKYHGPKGEISFSPKLAPETFRSPFTAAEGWGTYSQTIAAGKMSAALDLKYGQLRLKQVSLAMDNAPASPAATATLNGASVPVTCTLANGELHLQFATEVIIPAGQKLTLEIS